ncbi:hypothetical protein JOC36_000469 [Weissella uvarum]|nr:hypothetical protein [Weissella uvarum]
MYSNNQKQNVIDWNTAVWTPWDPWTPWQP